MHEDTLYISINRFCLRESICKRIAYTARLCWLALDFLVIWFPNGFRQYASHAHYNATVPLLRIHIRVNTFYWYKLANNILLWIVRRDRFHIWLTDERIAAWESKKKWITLPLNIQIYINIYDVYTCFFLIFILCYLIHLFIAVSLCLFVFCVGNVIVDIFNIGRYLLNFLVLKEAFLNSMLRSKNVFQPSHL